MIKNNINNVLVKDLCTGCGVCKSVCVSNAIKLELNREGFYRPKVDKNKCIHCGLCLNICSGVSQDNSKINKDDSNIKKDGLLNNYVNFYKSWSKDKYLRYNSSSGGVIRSMIKELLESKQIDGAICLMENKDNGLNPKIMLIKNSNEVSKISKSKYFPIEFSSVINILKQNRGKYLIVGLPCHIASFKKAYDLRLIKNKLIFIDLICIRNPSISLIKKYLNFLKINKTYKLDFRDKKYGWFNYSINVNNILIKRWYKTLFGFFGLKRMLFVQNRCYKCLLALNSFADITVGDDWSEKESKYEGISIVITRNSKGETYLNKCKNLKLIKKNKSLFYNSQPNLIKRHKYYNWYNKNNRYHLLKKERFFVLPSLLRLENYLCLNILKSFPLNKTKFIILIIDLYKLPFKIFKKLFKK